ncbi:hypothetical protein BDV96DRAFT_328330 [Lophiotrema nucula]|uniref:Uncharacterized protein n=1 Tax=Lophiotrema nucula TaxID=690887 RepID=A0A6A5YHU9_9PLEO|nr:hypothetical protein BDV96DRAFT_328330 [Lophiotrema nucula]
MRARFQDASKEQKDDPTDTLRNFIPHGTSSDGRKDLVPSALLRKLDDKKVTMGLINMYGCTSIVVVSKKAIWWSHFWEGPSFGFWEHTARGQFWRDNWIYTPNNERDGDLMPTQFRMDVLDTLWAVGPCSMREPPRNFKGIWCETGGEGLFKPETEPEVMIIAPRKDRFDVALDLYPKVQSNLRYPGHVNAITNTLKDIFKDDPDFGTDRIHTYGYDASDGHDKEADPTNEGGNPFAYTKMNGKFIFQYDPREATVPHQKAAMQLWAELQPKPILEKTWEVPACQAEYQRLLDAVDSDGNSTADFCGCSSSNCTMEIRYCSATCKECLSSDLGNITFDAVVAELPRPSSNPSPDQAFNFLKYELMEAQAEQLRSPSLLTNFLPHGVDSAANTGVPTTVFRDFWTNPVKFGIVNLYGCTSVMVISELAFWASHFWEIPAFRADESATALSPKFQSDVLDWISSTEFCWITLRGQTRSSSLACEVGRGRFSPLWSPQIVILTPKNREKLYSGNLQEPYTAQPGVIDYNRLEYPVEVKKIIDELRGVFQQTEASFLGQVTVVDYKPIRSDPGATPPEIGGSGQYKWAAGKFLLEYDPRAKPGMDGVRNRAAGVDVWAEDRPVPVFSRRWRPWLCQHSLTDPVKRDLSEAEEAPKVCECDVWSCPYSTLSTQTSSSTASSSSNRAGTSTVFVTVQPTPSPTPSFAHGVCRIRIQESTNDERKHTKMHLEIQDNNQRLIYSGDRDDIGRGKTIYISADDHPLGYDISITLDWADNGDWREFGNTLRFGGSSKVDYQATDKRKTPYCDAQDWDYGKFYVIFGLDKHPTRQADCFWTC